MDGSVLWDFIIKFFFWGMEHDYLELGDLQSLLSILIGVNFAPPFFAVALETQANHVLGEHEKLKKVNEALWDFRDNALPMIGSAASEDVSGTMVIIQRLEESSRQMQEMIGNAFASIPALESRMKSEFVWLLRSALALTILLLVTSVIPKFKITPFMLSGGLLITTGLNWRVVTMMRRHIHFMLILLELRSRLRLLIRLSIRTLTTANGMLEDATTAALAKKSKAP